jgi:hypothetical protein
MSEYDNYFSWTSRISDVITKIEDLNPGIKIDHSNYREIFDHLSDYIKIDKLMTNTDFHPFLFNAFSGAKNFLDHEFKIIFLDLVAQRDLDQFELCDQENNCEINKIRKEFFHGLEKFFEKSESDLDLAMSEAFPDYNHNLHFINYEEILEKALEKFIEFNKSEKNSTELIEGFKKIIEKYKNFQYGEDGSYKWDFAFKFDFAKLMSIFDSETNVLTHDFDQIEHFDIKIPENSKNMHKFMIEKFDIDKKNSYDRKQCAFTINYLPKTLEKLYLVFFEHTMDHVPDFQEKLNFLISSEVRLEILFEYLASKNFKTNEEIENFFKEKSYQDIYQDFDKKYKEFMNEKSWSKRSKTFNKVHFKVNDSSFMHLKNDHGQNLVYHYSDCYNGKCGSWHKTNKEIEKMSSHKNIFDQISSGLSFL